MRTTKITQYIEKIEGTQVFESTPEAVQAAWEAHREFYLICQTRKLRTGESEPYLSTLMSLQRLVRRHAHTTGYFRVDNGRYLVGYGGWVRDPKWLVPHSQG